MARRNGMTLEEQTAALSEIASEALRLRTIAVRAGADIVAFQLAVVFDEARSEIDRRGLPIDPESQPKSGKVVPLK